MLRAELPSKITSCQEFVSKRDHKKRSKHGDETHVCQKKKNYMLNMFVAVGQGLKLDALAQHIVITY